MKLKQLFTDEDAVSPVIGVILMVAITVILAAVIGTFVLGLGDQVSSSAPTASFTFDYQDGTTTANEGTCDSAGGNNFGGNGLLTMTHDGGDGIDAGDIDITDGDTTNTWQTCSDAGAATSKVSAGTDAEAVVDSGDTIRIVWTGGDDTATLGKWEGPDA